MMEVLARNWALVVLRGAAAVLFGLVTLLAPAISLAVLVFFFGAYALADGIFTAIAAVANRRNAPRWGALLVSGLLGIVVGLVTFIWPGVTALALAYIIAFWAIVLGIGEIAAAVRLQRAGKGEWVLLLAGVLSIAFGLLLALSPAVGALALVFWIGWFALVIGFVRIVTGLRLHRWAREDSRLHTGPR